MSVVKATTNKYGPATLDIQIEQGADFVIGVTLTKIVDDVPGPWDLTNATFDAHASSEWSPGGAKITFDVQAVDLPNGKISIVFPAASSLAIPLEPLPHQPKKTVSPSKFTMGGWVLNVTDQGVTSRMLEGTLYLDRDPCRT